LSTEIYQLIEREIPALRVDRRLSDLLEASVAENVETVLHILRHGIDVADVAPPAAAAEHARRLAQLDVPAAALIRAYRVGQARFLARCIDQLLQLTEGEHLEGLATQRMLERVSEYTDRVVEQVLTAYAHARDRWLRNRGAVLAMRVKAVLQDNELGDRTVAGAQRLAFGYQLERTHVGLVMWCEAKRDDHTTLDTLNDEASRIALAARSSDSPLFVPFDEASAWVWLPFDTGAELTHDQILTVLSVCDPNVSLAVGEPGSGLAGFRRTHQQALSAQTVALVAGRKHFKVTPYVDVAPVAMMAADIDSARAWVVETLGSLAIDSPRHARLRDTARVFLGTGGSYTATAEQLSLHRNTAQYRIQKAEEMRGRPLRDGRLDVELALLASHWLGQAVLQPPLHRSS